MALTLSVFVIGNGDLIKQVFDAVAAVFNNSAGIASITSLAVMLGGLFATFEFSKSRDIAVLMRWAGMYVLVTSLILYPKATVVIEDRTGIDEKARIVDHVPLSLAIFASVTSRIGIGFTEVIETVFHMPDDMSYNKTGMLMGSNIVLAAKNFQITDATTAQTLNEFMQQCVFYDLLLKRYTVQDLVHAGDPWMFIESHTSQARAFPLNGKITVCKQGTSQLDRMLRKATADAATIYGGQILGSKRAKMLLPYLSEGYSFLTDVSLQGADILKRNLLNNVMSQALSHYSANANAPAALQAYEDTKAELQSRETMDLAGRQAGIWMQHFKNIIEAVLYSSFIFIYFLSYFPFGGAIIRNYLFGMFTLQALAPMYAMINYTSNFLAQSRSLAFFSPNSHHDGLSIADIAGITQANADAIAVAGYLMWPVTIGGAVMLFRGLPGAIQSMGQTIGGIVQHTGSHVAGETIGGNISAGNANFGNRSLYNTNANHWDTNVRYAAGSATFQTGTGSTLSITPSGTEVLDNRGGQSNLGVSVILADSKRSMASSQAQSSLNAALSKNHAASEQYSAAFRKIDDYSSQHGQSKSSGSSSSQSATTGFSKSAQDVSQLINRWSDDHHVSHERRAQLFGQIHADLKSGVSGSASMNVSSSFGSLYGKAHQYAVDNHFTEMVDSAEREAKELSYKEGSDESNREVNSIASSFDRGDSYREEASSQLSQSDSYAKMASTSTESSASSQVNDTQEFYEWMRGKHSPSAQYGRGTWSISAIDNMAIHDPSHLRSHVDRFMQEKMGREMQSFKESNHLTQGEDHIQEVYKQNNQQIKNPTYIEKQHQHFSKIAKHDYMLEHPNGIGNVDKSIKNNSEKNSQANKEKLHEKQKYLISQSAPLEAHVDKKVKGQVFGSLNVVEAAKDWIDKHSDRNQ